MSTPKIKRIGLVAHDNKKADLIAWAKAHRTQLAACELCATGTTGQLLEEALQLPVRKLLSGPLGGDQQMGALIAAEEIDFLIFFWDPLEPLPHDPDIKALLRIAIVWNVPVASNQASADYMFASELLLSDYQRRRPDFSAHAGRNLPGPSELEK